MNKWYVYGHYSKGSGELFYIGVGTGGRKNDLKSRNSIWTRVATESGFTVSILESGFTDRDKAVRREVELQCLHRPKACKIYGDGDYAIPHDRALEAYEEGGIELVFERIRNPVKNIDLSDNCPPMTVDELIHSSSAGYTKIPNELFNLTLRPEEKLLLLVISKWDNKPMHPMSSSYLAEAIGVSRSKLIRVKNLLVDNGYIISKSLGKGKSKTYVVNWLKIKLIEENK